jgi:hypothetical protein
VDPAIVFPSNAAVVLHVHVESQSSRSVLQADWLEIRDGQDKAVAGDSHPGRNLNSPTMHHFLDFELHRVTFGLVTAVQVSSVNVRRNLPSFGV